jgi:DNA-directed RNA polymerase subunit beta'
MRLETAGDTDLIPGELVDEHRFRAAQENLRELQPATGNLQLLGITQVAMRSQSFLSAASFERTDQVLRDAALAGKVDELAGLKGNVLLGRLIPAGTGFHSAISEVRIPASALECSFSNS